IHAVRHAPGQLPLRPRPLRGECAARASGARLKLLDLPHERLPAPERAGRALPEQPSRRHRLDGDRAVRRQRPRGRHRGDRAPLAMADTPARIEPSAWRLPVAPMLAWTDTWRRVFHRLLAPHERLYTQMVHANAVIHGDRAKLLVL